MKQLCHEYCNVNGAFYMATQFGNECFCSREGDLDFDRHDVGTCDKPCAGDDVSWSCPAVKTIVALTRPIPACLI